MTAITLEFGGAPHASARPQRARLQQGVPAPRLRLTQRGRRVLLGLAATPLVIGALVFALNGGGATASLEGSSAPVEYVYVESGQTLWALASEIAPESDPRDVIAALVEFNGLSSQDVYAGQELAVPAAYTH